MKKLFQQIFKCYRVLLKLCATLQVTLSQFIWMGQLQAIDIYNFAQNRLFVHFLQISLCTAECTADDLSVYCQ